MIVLLLGAVVGTAAAQTPEPTAVPTSQPAEPTTYVHPIVQILAAYFGRESRPTLATPTPTETPTVDPSATPTETPTVTPVVGSEEFAKQIALYHDEGMGFGVLVKLYAMAEASTEACVKLQPTPGPTADPNQPAASPTVEPTQPACVPVTVDELVSEFQGGTGMGQLFKEFGKPALLGVGQVRKALQHLPQVTPTPSLTETPTTTGDGSALQSQNPTHGKGHPKVKTPNPHGPKK